jgi:hypothetical protein
LGASRAFDGNRLDTAIFQANGEHRISTSVQQHRRRHREIDRRKRLSHN